MELKELMKAIGDFLKKLFTKDGVTMYSSVILALIPVLISLVSAYHSYYLFALGNTQLVAIAVALIYEMMSLGVLAIIIINPPGANANELWGVYTFTVLIQIVGNVYYGFDFVLTQLATDASHINHFVRLLNHIATISLDQGVWYLSILLGAPIPLIGAVLFHVSAASITKVIEGIDKAKADAEEAARLEAEAAEQARIKELERIEQARQEELARQEEAKRLEQAHLEEVRRLEEIRLEQARLEQAHLEEVRRLEEIRLEQARRPQDINGLLDEVNRGPGTMGMGIVLPDI